MKQTNEQQINFIYYFNKCGHRSLLLEIIPYNFNNKPAKEEICV